MSRANDSVRKTVDDIFRELAGEDRARWLDCSTPSRCTSTVAESIRSQSGYSEAVAQEIGFHVGDWQGDAAFVVALHLFPERFTPEEIDEGVRSLLLHVPHHVVAAVRLAGHPTDDIFKDDKS